MATQRSRKWRLSQHMIRSELVRTAFLAVMTAEEHEIRESFRYRGRPIFGPHVGVEVLASVMNQQSASQELRPVRNVL